MEWSKLLQDLGAKIVNLEFDKFPPDRKPFRLFVGKAAVSDLITDQVPVVESFDVNGR